MLIEAVRESEVHPEKISGPNWDTLSFYIKRSFLLEPDNTVSGHVGTFEHFNISLNNYSTYTQSIWID